LAPEKESSRSRGKKKMAKIIHFFVLFFVFLTRKWVGKT
jgi:hypothetical protein